MAVTKQRVTPGFPFAVYVNETAQKQRVAPVVYVNETAPPVAAATGNFLLLFRP